MTLQLYNPFKKIVPKFSLHAFTPVEDVGGLSLSPKLSKYTLLKMLGEGSFGTVWLAETTLLDGTRGLVAIKVAPRYLHQGSDLYIHRELDFLDLFTRTAPGSHTTTQLIEAFTDEYNYYIIQEYVAGGTLRDELLRSRRGRLDPERAVHILVQLISTVNHLHQHGVSHRDLKPENILLDAYGNAVLADFGLAFRFRRVETETTISCDTRSTNARCGTIGYMAPQVFKREEYTSASDIFSLGAIFYEMLTGMMPFSERDFEKGEPTRKDFLDPLYSFSSETTDLLSGMLEWNEARRVRIEDIRAHPVFRDVDWDAIEARKYQVRRHWAPPTAKIDRERRIDRNTLLHGDARRSCWFRVGLGPLDRAFNVPFQPVRVARPSPPTSLLRPKLPPIRIPPRAIRDAQRQQPGNVNTSVFVNQLSSQRISEEGENVNATRAPVSPVPFSRARRAIDIRNNRLSSEHEAAAKYSVFEGCIEQVDELLLSTSAGIGPRAFAFRAQSIAPSPSLVNSAFLPVQVTPRMLLPPQVPVLDSDGTSLASSSGLITPASEQSRYVLSKNDRYF